MGGKKGDFQRSLQGHSVEKHIKYSHKFDTDIIKMPNRSKMPKHTNYKHTCKDRESGAGSGSSATYSYEDDLMGMATFFCE